MALRYFCPNCGNEIITSYLKPGDNLACAGCSFEFVVPQDAVITDETPNIINKKVGAHALPPHLLQGEKKEDRPTLKFCCNLCGKMIISKSVCRGDMLRCPDCGGIIRVPTDAETTDEAPNLAIDIPDPLAPIYFDETRPIEPSPPPGPTMWGVKDIFKFIVLNIIGIFLVEGILHLLAALLIWWFAPDLPAWPSDWPDPYHFHFIRIESIFSDIMTISLIYYIIVKKHRNRNFFEILHLDKISKNAITKYGLIALGTLLFIIGLFELVSITPLGKDIPKNLPIDELWKLGYPMLIWSTFMAPLAAMPEEIVFRGFIFLGLKKSIGQTWAAIIATLMFILLHGPQLAFSPFHLIIIGIGATIFMVIRIKTDSLTKSILVHFYYNFIIVLFVWFLVIIKGISILTKAK